MSIPEAHYRRVNDSHLASQLLAYPNSRGDDIASKNPIKQWINEAYIFTFLYFLHKKIKIIQKKSFL